MHTSPLLAAAFVAVLISTATTAPAQPGESDRDREVVVRNLLSPDTFTYATAKEELNPADLPILYEILDELASYESWGNTATAVGFLGESDASYKALTDFVKSPQRFGELEDYEDLHQSVLINLLMNKILAIRWLPFLDEAKGTKMLRDILSNKEIAETYLQNWIDEEIPRGFGDVRRAAMELRAAAAMGLIFHDRERNLPVVQQQFEIVNRQYKEIPSPEEATLSDDQKLQNGHLAMLQSSLVHALAIAGYIEEHGTEEYLAASSSYKVRHDIRFRFSKLAHELGIYD